MLIQKWQRVAQRISLGSEVIEAINRACTAHPEIDRPDKLAERVLNWALGDQYKPKRTKTKLNGFGHDFTRVRYRNGYKNGNSAPKLIPEPAEIGIDLRESEWDPEPLDPYMESSRCRALLLEILRRAAYDWVLYRQSSRLADRKLAEEAYEWLFVEGPDSPGWQERIDEDKTLTSFYFICENLDLDPEKVREHLRKMTIRDVMSVGRPAERRHRESEEIDIEEHSLSGFSLDSVPSYDPAFQG